MKHITFNTSPSPELAGPRESLEFSCKGLSLARLGMRETLQWYTGEKEEESHRERMRNSELWIPEAKSIFIYMKC